MRDIVKSKPAVQPDVAGEPKARAPSTARLTLLIKAVKDAGDQVSKVEVGKGKIILTIGKPGEAPSEMEEIVL